jgi:hypothetical protein
LHGRKGRLVRDSIADIESFRTASQGWPDSIGMGGRLPSESMAGFRRNQWPLCVGIRIYGLELDNGSRVMALPSDDDTIRGLTVDAWIVADEAARLDEDLIAALRPMRARRPHARFAMLSTAWSHADPFWTAWAGDNPTWIRLKATADMPGAPFTQDFLKQERLDLGEQRFKREYLGIPGGGEASPFTWDLFERATRIHVPKAPPGPAFGPPPQQPAAPIPNPFKTLKQIGAAS